MTADFIVQEMLSIANPEKAAHLQRFFKTGPGQYAEGDIFLGLIVPLTRSIAKANRQTPLPEVQKLIVNKYHEARLCALLILVDQFKKGSPEEQEKIYRFYLKNARYANNWDLVDLSCPYIIGTHLLDKERDILYQLSQSDNLWEQRISIVSTITFIRNRQFDDTLALAKHFFSHKHDLIHKATGWMLREIGKKDREVLTNFLEVYATQMPRTSLRYAIEHYPEPERQYFLKKR